MGGTRTASSTSRGGATPRIINLSEKTEPDIYQAIREDAMLENVALNYDEDGGLVPDFFDTTKTENGGVSYRIFHIDNYVSRGCPFLQHRFSPL